MGRQMARAVLWNSELLSSTAGTNTPALRQYVRLFPLVYHLFTPLPYEAKSKFKYVT